MAWQYHKFAHSICKVFPEKLLMTSLYLYILRIYFPSVAYSVSRTNNIILKRRVLLRSYRVGPKGLSALLNYIIDIDFFNPHATRTSDLKMMKPIFWSQNDSGVFLKL